MPESIAAVKRKLRSVQNRLPNANSQLESAQARLWRLEAEEQELLAIIDQTKGA